MHPMNRRDSLVTTGSMGLLAAVGALACVSSAEAQGAAAPPAPHHHGDPELAAAAHGCIAKGNACLAHAIALLSAGDTSMAGCAAAAFDMHAVMGGLAAVATSGGKRLGELARTAMGFCKDCESECRKHEPHHAACLECADACARTAAACAKYAA
jgi:Cys-rich four helix bundle protein (predicted Tat secretion target)